MPSASAFVTKAESFVGDPYSFGAAGPFSFDCSGLVQYALEQVGLQNVPRTSEAQWSWVQHITAAQLQPGDLIFEQWPGDQTSPGHVVIYTGNGRIEQAPQTGELVQNDGFSAAQISAEGATVVGYGRIPGLSYSGSSISTVAANVIPGWLQGVLGFIPGGSAINAVGGVAGATEDVQSNVVDWLERGALMVFGGALIVLGIWRMSGGSPTKQQADKEEDKQKEVTAPDTQEVEEIAS